VTVHLRWGYRKLMVETGLAEPCAPLRLGTGDVIPGMRALPAELRDRPGVP
jgi:hypothetical protein